MRSSVPQTRHRNGCKTYTHTKIIQKPITTLANGDALGQHIANRHILPKNTARTNNYSPDTTPHLHPHITRNDDTPHPVIAFMLQTRNKKKQDASHTHTHIQCVHVCNGITRTRRLRNIVLHESRRRVRTSAKNESQFSWRVFSKRQIAQRAKLGL